MKFREKTEKILELNEEEARQLHDLLETFDFKHQNFLPDEKDMFRFASMVKKKIKKEFTY